MTIYAVFKGSGISFDELMQSIRDASGVGIALAAVCMLGFIYFEGEAVRVIVNHMGYPAKRSHGLCIRQQMSIFRQLRLRHPVVSRQVLFL